MGNFLAELGLRLRFLVYRALPVSALSLAAGLSAVTVLGMNVQITDLVPALMIPLVLFGLLARILGVVMAVPEDSAEKPRPFSDLPLGYGTRLAVNFHVFGAATILLAFMSVVAWPLYAWGGLEQPFRLSAALFAAHLVLGLALVRGAYVLAFVATRKRYGGMFRPLARAVTTTVTAFRT